MRRHFEGQRVPGIETRLPAWADGVANMALSGQVKMIVLSLARRPLSHMLGHAGGTIGKRVDDHDLMASTQSFRHRFRVAKSAATVQTSLQIHRGSS